MVWERNGRPSCAIHRTAGIHFGEGIHLSWVMEENLDRKPHVYRGWKTDLCPLSTIVVSAGGIGTLSS